MTIFENKYRFWLHFRLETCGFLLKYTLPRIFLFDFSALSRRATLKSICKVLKNDYYEKRGKNISDFVFFPQTIRH